MAKKKKVTDHRVLSLHLKKCSHCSSSSRPQPKRPKASFSKSLLSSLEWDEHALHSLDWDSIMKDGGLHDDSLANVLKSTVPQSNPCDPHVPHLPEFPNSQEVPFDQAPDLSLSDVYMSQNMGCNYKQLLDHLVQQFNHGHSWQSNGFDMIKELIRAADCFDTSQLQLAQVILDRLNQRLRSPVGKPLHRAAFYFKDALQSLLSCSNRTPRLSSLVEIVQSIRTFKAFSGISPIPMFSIFTTNQALLEALHGSSFMHIIDFEIGLGIQYAPLMKEMAEKSESCKINSPVLRITAVVPEEYAVESKLIRENLNQFASDLRIRVQIEFVLFRTFETSLLNAVKFMEGEKAAVLLTPTIFRRLGSTKNIAAFLGDIRRVSPSVVVFVDGEGWADDATATSFRRSVVNSLEFYSVVLESLDASLVGGCGEWIRRIEMLLLRPKILAAVESGGRRVPAWRDI
ncbi:scarecrow-like protein 15 [Neltuma alba]|uniref:scarecrow-like protein 15 n=1 Tax=Neltuma alba TaxID=207710 RepID=UPI0010A4F24F|nr:scarecrow-like protein 15 [Prosopis alba]